MKLIHVPLSHFFVMEFRITVEILNKLQTSFFYQGPHVQMVKSQVHYYFTLSSQSPLCPSPKYALNASSPKNRGVITLTYLLQRYLCNINPFAFFASTKKIFYEKKKILRLIFKWNYFFYFLCQFPREK